jgi:16S rRNA (guanine(966)-N(2))-methyltransferase RsmD
MRVIAGRYRGKRLKGPRGVELRPTSDRLKGTLFDILGSRLADSVVLDAFAGTGAIGIEAFSRGAREVVFVESGPLGCRLIRENLQLCGITSEFRLLDEDVFKSLRRLAREGCRFDVVILDPPYNWRPYADLLDILFRSPLIRSGSLVIIEHHRKAELPQSAAGYHRLRVVTQGDKHLSFYAANPSPDPQPTQI